MKSQIKNKIRSLFSGLSKTKNKKIIFILVFATAGLLSLLLSFAAPVESFKMIPNFDAKTRDEFTSQPGIRETQQSSVGRIVTEKNVHGLSNAVKFTAKYPDDNGVAMSRPDGCQIGDGCAYAERTEIRLSDSASDAPLNSERWWGWNIFIPSDLPKSPSDVKFNIITQLHGGSGSPPFALGYVDIDGIDWLVLEQRGGDANQNYRRHKIKPLQRGKWYSFVSHFKFSASSTAMTEFWVDKSPTEQPDVTDTLANHYSSGGHYVKFGIYRGSYRPNTNPAVIYHANWSISNSSTKAIADLYIPGSGTQQPGGASNDDQLATSNLLTGLHPSSTSSQSSYTADKVNDLDNSTRWIASNNLNNQSVQFDLAKKYNLGNMTILWATKSTKNYKVETSLDGTNWSTVLSGSTSLLANDDPTATELKSHSLSSVAKFIRITGVDLHSNWSNVGHSIYEITLTGTEHTEPVNNANLVIYGVSNGQIISGGASVEAVLTGDTAADKVEFLIDDVVYRSEQNAPYCMAVSQGNSCDLWDSKKVSNGVHSITAIAHLTDGKILKSKVDFTVSNASGSDNASPSIPASLKLMSVGKTEISFMWQKSSDNVRVRGYYIYRNNGSEPIAFTTNNSYSDLAVRRNKVYSYQVTAVDDAGNESGKSNTIEARAR